MVEVAFTNTELVANKFVEVTLVNTAVEAPAVPIGVLLIEPPSIVRPFTAIASVIELAGKGRTAVTARLVDVTDVAIVFTKTVEVAKRLVDVTLVELMLLGFKLVAVKLVAFKVVKKPLVEVILVARIIVEVTAVPLAEVKKSGPVSVPPASGR